MARNRGYFEREANIIITAYYPSQRFKILQEFKVVRFNKFIEISLLEF